MRIQNKLVAIYSFVFGIILLFFILGIYIPYVQAIHDDYFDRLHLRGVAKVDLLDGETVSGDVLHLIYQNTPGDYEPHVTIYTNQGDLVYRDKRVMPESRHHSAMMERLLKDHRIDWWSGKWQTDGFYIEGSKANYLVFVTGYDNYGLGHLRHMQWILFIAYLFAMMLVVFTVRLFAAQAFRPVSAMIAQAGAITSSNLEVRLNEGNKKDELAMLAITFNHMLDQLEQSFEDQRHLVYSISHELRTPLAAIIAQLELSLSHEMNQEEYFRVIKATLFDANRLSRLSTNLLDMAKASYEPGSIIMENVRLDELLIEVVGKVQAMGNDYSVNLFFDKEPENESDITLYGNKYLLSASLFNLAENGCKYAYDKACDVHISYSPGLARVSFIDRGIGILPEDEERIFVPFYRGSNRGDINGNGIGLPLAKKIILLHHGTVRLKNEPEKTIFIVEFPIA